jgi:hypothetical protein
VDHAQTQQTGSIGDAAQSPDRFGLTRQLVEIDIGRESG